MGRSKQAKAYETREIILNAVAACLATTDYDCIAVKDVITLANVSRSTFYRYFFSVDEALSELEDKYLDAMLSINRMALMTRYGGDLEQLTPTLIMRLEMLQEDYPAVLALLGPHGSPRFAQKEAEIMRSYLSEKARGIALSSEEIDLYITYCIEGHNGLIRSWLSSYPELPAASVAQLLNRLLYSPLLEPGR